MRASPSTSAATSALSAAGLDEVHFAFAATESFNRRNQNASVEESLAAALRIAGRAKEDGIRATVTIGVSFGCPFEGPVDPGRVADLAERLAPSFDEVVFADTIGVAVPREVKHLIGRARLSGTTVGAHLHNTRNTGYANALAALEAGATVLDASVGGIGGCPFAPRATGNIGTEDLVYVLHGEGVETGIDLAALIGVAEWLESVLAAPARGIRLPRGDACVARRLKGEEWHTGSGWTSGGPLPTCCSWTTKRAISIA